MSQRYLLVISNPEQAAFRLRWQSIIAPLADRGITIHVEVRPRGALARRKLAHSAGDYAGVIIQRKLLEVWEAKQYRKHARRMLFDVDDAVMFRAKKDTIFSRWRQSRRFKATARILDMAAVGNEYLKDMFTKAGCPDCRILPTTLDVSRYWPKQHQRGHGVKLVWIGSRSTLPYLAALVPTLEVIHGQPHDLELITIADATVQSRILPIRHIPWGEQSEAGALLQGDIGIAPTPDNPWARGKCGFKILQYMAAGLPVLASPVGANASIVKAGLTGYLPATEGEWSKAITQLGADAALRQKMGDAGRRLVEQEYTLGRAIDFWANILAPAPAANFPK